MPAQPYDESFDDITVREEIAVICPNHGQVLLTTGEYNRQLAAADRGWYCPRCGETASFDEDLMQAYLESFEDADA
jgi:predicted RNA-binding Zn-ribbon protein involved in translation (DUF1610 family)